MCSQSVTKGQDLRWLLTKLMALLGTCAHSTYLLCPTFSGPVVYWDWGAQVRKFLQWAVKSAARESEGVTIWQGVIPGVHLDGVVPVSKQKRGKTELGEWNHTAFP